MAVLRRIASLAVAVFLVLSGGCGGASYRDGAHSQAAAVTPRRLWVVRGDLRNVHYAIDASKATAAIAPLPYDGATVTIDLAKPCLFNMIAVEHGPDEWGFCRRVRVLTSLDGEAFTNRFTAAGTRWISTFCLIEPTLARYVRLEAIQPGQRPWSVAEIHIQ